MRFPAFFIFNGLGPLKMAAHPCAAVPEPLPAEPQAARLESTRIYSSDSRSIAEGLFDH